MSAGVIPWIEAMRGRGGPLVDAASSFVAALGTSEFPRGAEGLRRLAAAVAAFAADDGPFDDDDRVIEGAGALLGLILLDELGAGRHGHDGHRHGIALGDHGYFDPFAAVEAAIEADAPRAELARRVREAEDEHAGVGPIARVVGAFRGALVRGRPDLEVESVRALSVVLGGGVEVDLTQVARATSDEPRAAVDDAVRKLVAMLPGGPDDCAISAGDARERLLPRLVGSRFHAELEARAGGEGARLHGRPIGNGVRVALVLAFPGRSRFVREDEIGRWGMTGAEAERVALARLASLSAQARFAHVETPDGSLVIARTGDGLDAARLLLPGLFDVLRAALDGPIFAAVPHRDVLLASGPGRARDALRARAADDFARAPHAITAELFEIAAGGLRGT